MTRIFSVATLVTVVALASGDTAMGQASISLTANAVVQPNDNTKVAFTGTGYFEFNGAGNGTFGSVTIKIRYNNGD